MFKITRFDKQILHMVYTKIWLMILVVAFAVLFTLFLAMALMSVYGWSLLATAVFCLFPWLLVTIIAASFFYVAQRQYQEDKAEFLESGRNALIGRAVIAVAQYVFKKYSQK